MKVSGARTRTLLAAALAAALALAPPPAARAGYFGIGRFKIRIGGPRQIDLKPLHGKLLLLRAILRRHPDILTSNLQFRRNLIDALEPVPGLLALLGNEGALTTLGDTEWIGGRYASDGNWAYDETQLRALKTGLEEDLGKLPLALAVDFATDLEALRAAASHPENGLDDAEFKRSIGRLLRVAPFLYDAEGKALASARRLNPRGRSRLVEQIRSASPEDLSNRYGDLLAAHLLPALEAIETRSSAQLRGAISALKNQYLAKDVRKALTAVGAAVAGSSIRELSLERIPPIVALFRGMFGGDCSALSVPYYPLHKDVRVYWIRRNFRFDTQPLGYALAVPIVVDGRVVPYLITVNGTQLGDADVKHAIDLVARDFGSEEVLLPEFSAPGGYNYYLVNTDTVRRAMSPKDATSVEVELPAGWGKIEGVVEESLKKYRLGNYHNYYQAADLRRARLHAVRPDAYRWAGQIQRGQVETPYEVDAKLGDLPLKDRAILAASAVSDRTSRRQQGRIRRELQVSDAQIEIGAQILQATQDRPISHATLLRAEELVGFTLDDVMDLDLYTRLSSLVSIHGSAPADFRTPEEWKALFERAVLEIDREMLRLKWDDSNHRQAIEKTLAARGRVPHDLRPRNAKLVPFMVELVRNGGHFYNFTDRFRALLPLPEAALDRLVELLGEDDLKIVDRALDALAATTAGPERVSAFIDRQLGLEESERAPLLSKAIEREIDRDRKGGWEEDTIRYFRYLARADRRAALDISLRAIRAKRMYWATVPPELEPLFEDPDPRVRFIAAAYLRPDAKGVKQGSERDLGLEARRQEILLGDAKDSGYELAKAREFQATIEALTDASALRMLGELETRQTGLGETREFVFARLKAPYSEEVTRRLERLRGSHAFEVRLAAGILLWRVGRRSESDELLILDGIERRLVARDTKEWTGLELDRMPFKSLGAQRKVAGWLGRMEEVAGGRYSNTETLNEYARALLLKNRDANLKLEGADDLEGDLARLLEGQPEQALPATEVLAHYRWLSRHPQAERALVRGLRDQRSKMQVEEIVHLLEQSPPQDFEACLDLARAAPDMFRPAYGYGYQLAAHLRPINEKLPEHLALLQRRAWDRLLEIHPQPPQVAVAIEGVLHSAGPDSRKILLEALTERSLREGRTDLRENRALRDFWFARQGEAEPIIKACARAFKSPH